MIRQFHSFQNVFSAFWVCPSLRRVKGEGLLLKNIRISCESSNPRHAKPVHRTGTVVPRPPAGRAGGWGSMRQRKHWLRMARIFQFVRYAGHIGVLLPRLGIPRQDIFSHTIIAYTSRIAILFLKKSEYIGLFFLLYSSILLKNTNYAHF